MSPVRTSCVCSETNGELMTTSLRDIGCGRGSVLLGVSLANRVFNRRFARSLAQWLQANAVRQVHVVVFDEIEAINYQVFRGMDLGCALGAAQRRGAQFQTMFRRELDGCGASVTVELESECLIRAHAQYATAVGVLSDALNCDVRFATDVQRQVLTNLAMRVEKHGRGAINARMVQLRYYLIRELSFVDTYLSLRPDSVEAYPAPNLNVKLSLWGGEYPTLRRFERPGFASRYVDLSFLRERPFRGGFPSPIAPATTTGFAK